MHTYICRMKSVRKEVKLTTNIISHLQVAADSKMLSLKRYMEYVLVKEAERLYKKEISKHDKSK